MGGVEQQASRGGPPAGEGSTARPSPRHQKRAGRIKSPPSLPVLVHVASLLPLLWVAAALASDAFRNTSFLGAEPVEAAEHFTGEWALRFLIFSLAITPAIHLLRWGWLIRYRRVFGLYGFAYAVTHLAVYFGIDVQLTWEYFVEDLLKRLYITLGMLALLLLVPLALTSTKASIRRLGNRRWTALHRLAYVSVILGLVHFFMAVKRDITDPALFGLCIAALLGYRVWYWRRTRSHSAS